MAQEKEPSKVTITHACMHTHRAMRRVLAAGEVTEKQGAVFRHVSPQEQSVKLAARRTERWSRHLVLTPDAVTGRSQHPILKPKGQSNVSGPPTWQSKNFKVAGDLCDPVGLKPEWVWAQTGNWKQVGL